jgi:hypothetical protein
LVDENLSTKEKMKKDFERRLDSKCLDLSLTYEEDALRRFIQSTKSVTNYPESFIKKLYRTNISSNKDLMVAWVYGIDCTFSTTITEVYFDFFEKPSYLNQMDMQVRPEFLKALISNSNPTKEENKMLKNTKIALFPYMNDRLGTFT